ALRAMSRLATLKNREGEAAEGLRVQASREFVTAQQLADQAAFEIGAPTPEGVNARERLQRAAAEAQSIFLTQLAIAHLPLDGVAVPHALDSTIERFDTEISNSLKTIA